MMTILVKGALKVKIEMACSVAMVMKLEFSFKSSLYFDNFEFDENVKKFFKLVENTVGKGEIARYKQFLLFPQCFQKTSSADT